MNYLRSKLKYIISSVVKILEAWGYPLFLNKSDGKVLKNYQIYGNSIQNGVPTEANPIEIKFVGDKVTDTTDANYEKYKIPVKVSGKNLFDGIWTEGTLANGNIAVNPNHVSTLNYIRVNPNITYYFSETTNKLTKMVITYYNSNKEYISVSTSNSAFTTPSNAYYIRFRNYLADSDKIIDLLNGKLKCQIEENSTETEYEPYQEPIITNIYLDEPLRLSDGASDYIDFETQTLHRQVGVQIATGKEQWSAFYMGTPNVVYRFMVTSQNIVKNGDFYKQYFTHFTSVLCATTNTDNGASIYYSSGVGGTLFRFRPTDLESYGSSISEFLTFIRSEYAKGTPVTGYYPLLNETVEEIELPEILTLKNSNVITLDTEINPIDMYAKYISK